jgi:hypothetical protein
VRTYLTLFGYAFTSRQLIKRRDGLCLLEVKQRPLTVFKGSLAATGPEAGINKNDRHAVS